MTKKIWVLLILAMLLTGMAIGGYYLWAKHQTKALLADADKLYRNKNYPQALDAYGRITADRHRFISPPERANLLINSGNCLYETGKYGEAVPFFAEAAELAEKHGLLNRIDAPTQFYDRWGGGYEAQNNYAAAETIYLQGITKLEQAYGNLYSGVTLLQARLGRVYLQQETYVKALNCFENVLKNPKFFAQQDDFGKAMIYGYIGAVYCHNNKLTEAAAAYEKCLPLTAKSFGVKSSRMGIEYTGLALVLHKQNKNIEAIKLLDEAYAIMKKQHGEKYRATQRIAKLREEWEKELTRHLSGRP